MRKIAAIVPALLLISLCASPASAQSADAPASSPGDTAFIMMSAALVLMMTPALAFFYGGMVQRKNILSVLMQCFTVMCAISLQWILIGYSLSFSPDIGGGIIGGLDWVGLKGVGLAPNPDYAAGVPHQAFMIFQAMFAVITPGLMVGAFTGRMKFSAFLVFMLLWATLVYDPMAHWVWGTGGWLGELGALDFAGGAVVHINAGVAALVTAVLIGKRKGREDKSFPPHHLPYTVLGTGLLWFGWFGFNAGSALHAGGLAVNAFVTTNTAAAAAGLVWAFLEWKQSGSPTMLGVATGAVAGLVSITPACGFVGPMAAIAVGAVGSALCYLAVVRMKPRLGYDDALDVFGVHGVGGMWGALATGLFAEEAINGANGLFFGDARQFLVQAVSVAVTAAFAGVATFILYKVVDALFGMRVRESDEIAGLDISQHKETAYTVIE